MTINVVERGTVVECSGPANEVLEYVSHIIRSRITICILDGKATACWAKE